MSIKFNPNADLYTDAKAKRRVSIAGKAGVALTITTIVATAFLLVRGATTSTQAIVLCMAAIWGIGGPIWFFYEYFFIYREFGASNSWELFKHGQQLSGAVWVALTAALAAFGTSDYVKVSNGSFRCELLNAIPNSPASSAPVKVLLSCESKS